MVFRRNPKPRSRIDSLIGAGTKISGNVVFSGGLRIDGEVVGDVSASGTELSTLVVSERAEVQGSVTVSHAVVNGTVKGPLVATELLELQRHARVLGDITYGKLEIHLGAVVEGRLTHQASSGARGGLKLASSNDTLGR